MNWKKHAKQAKAHKALGHTDVYLSEGPYPWQFVTSCELGGSHRLDISTDVIFRAKHPCGLTFRWSFDIEPRSANGKGHYQIDVPRIRLVMELLPVSARRSFKKYLAACSEAVLRKAREWKEITDRQFKDAADLEGLADET